MTLGRAVTLGIDGLELPIVLAPMAGGPSTPDLAVAVSEAGGLGLLAAGYRTAPELRDEVEAVRSRTRRPFGVNVFARPAHRGSDEEVRTYASSLEPEAARYGVQLGEPRFDDDEYDAKLALPMLSLLRVLARETSLPLVATGAIMDGPSIAATLCGGAAAAQLGTALMLTPEAGTTVAHREAIEGSSATALTRAFSGRLARGIVNRFMLEHNASAPHAYPEVHHLTSPLRAAARAAGDADAFNLWAGQAHALATRAPAGRLVAQLAAEARAALDGARMA